MSKNLTLWTIQPIEWYENLMRDGVIHAKRDLMDTFEDFEYAYQWLMKKMCERIGLPPYADIYPIWAWYQYENANKKRPDLRHSGFLEKGKKGVRVEFTKPAHEVLLSDFDLWLHPLNDWYVADTEEDHLKFDDILEKNNLDYSFQSNYPPEIRDMIENSWDKVLDMNYHFEYSANPYEKKVFKPHFGRCRLMK